ncbi:unnamed protein product [Taenia asiatica]|uniref:DUF4781 domain-containing protein n=1 Tax=Taenia asiatica TaxID=60517 RepID=A0A0R3WFX0_TAEAS|nr:unnamed protein product [Taenia asiatica]
MLHVSEDGRLVEEVAITKNNISSMDYQHGVLTINDFLIGASSPWTELRLDLREYISPSEMESKEENEIPMSYNIEEEEIKFKPEKSEVTKEENVGENEFIFVKHGNTKWARIGFTIGAALGIPFAALARAIQAGFISTVGVITSEHDDAKLARIGFVVEAALLIPSEVLSSAIQAGFVPTVSAITSTIGSMGASGISSVTVQSIRQLILIGRRMGENSDDLQILVNNESDDYDNMPPVDKRAVEIKMENVTETATKVELLQFRQAQIEIIPPATQYHLPTEFKPEILQYKPPTKIPMPANPLLRFLEEQKRGFKVSIIIN